MAYCPKCAIEVASAKFCNTCGSTLQSSKEETSPNAGSAKGLGKSDSKRAMWVHLTPLILIALFPVSIGMTVLFLWLPALIIRKTSDRSTLENRQAKSALNFHLSFFLYFLGLLVVGALIIVFVSLIGNGAAGIQAIPVVGFGLLILAGLAIGSFIKGAVAGARGKEFNYPIAIPFLK